MGEAEKHWPTARFPTAFLVLPNFHSCFYNSIETRVHVFCFLDNVKIFSGAKGTFTKAISNGQNCEPTYLTVPLLIGCFAPISPDEVPTIYIQYCQKVMRTIIDEYPNIIAIYR